MVAIGPVGKKSGGGSGGPAAPGSGGAASNIGWLTIAGSGFGSHSASISALPTSTDHTNLSSRISLPFFCSVNGATNLGVYLEAANLDTFAGCVLDSLYVRIATIDGLSTLAAYTDNGGEILLQADYTFTESWMQNGVYFSLDESGQIACAGAGIVHGVVEMTLSLA